MPTPTPRLRRPWFRRRPQPPGTAPGTLAVPSPAQPPVIRVLAYGPDRIEEQAEATVAEAGARLGELPVTWVHVEGLGDVEMLRGLGELFGLHPLALEDVTSLQQRAKVEDYQGQHFVIFHVARYLDALETEQVSLFVGDGWVLTFEEEPGNCFEAVRQRIRGGGGRIRGEGADYLAYALVDSAIDGYFPVVERCGERLEALEDTIIADPRSQVLGQLHEARRELLQLRRTVWPHQELINSLLRDATSPLSDSTRLYLRDCYDHVLRVIELVETLREMGSNLMDLHLSMASNRMNEVMKVLTIMSTIFIPLSFIAGLYGMNFDPSASPWSMPELASPWGYPIVLGVMALIVIGLFVFFRKKGWFGE